MSQHFGEYLRQELVFEVKLHVDHVLEGEFVPLGNLILKYIVDSVCPSWDNLVHAGTDIVGIQCETIIGH